MGRDLFDDLGGRAAYNRQVVAPCVTGRWTDIRQQLFVPLLRPVKTQMSGPLDPITTLVHSSPNQLAGFRVSLSLLSSFFIKEVYGACA